MDVTGATVFGSDDVTNAERGPSTHWSVRAQGLEETAVLDLISPPWGPPLISALGDIGVYRHDRLDVVPPDSQAANPVSGTSPSLDYAARTPGFVVRLAHAGPGERGAISTDAGRTLTPFPAEPPGLTTQTGRVAVSTDARTILWTPGTITPHYSRDRGATWSPVDGLPNQAVVAADRVDPNLFFAVDPGTGTAYRSVDGGRVFLLTATGLAGSGARLETVLDRAGHCWVARGDGGLYRSDDSGGSYKQLAAVQHAHTIGFGKGRRGSPDMAAYTSGRVAGQWGIFRSEDVGETWIRVNDDRHQYLAAVRSAHRQFWSAGVGVDVVHPAAELSPYRLVVIPALYSVNSANAAAIRSFVAAGGHVLVTYFSGIVDEHCRVIPRAYPGAFRDILGSHLEEFHPVAGARLERYGPGRWWSERINLEGAEPVDVYADGPLAGGPAITRYGYGEGTSWYVSTPDAGRSRSGPAARRDPHLDRPDQPRPDRGPRRGQRS